MSVLQLKNREKASKGGRMRQRRTLQNKENVTLKAQFKAMNEIGYR